MEMRFALSVYHPESGQFLAPSSRLDQDGLRQRSLYERMDQVRIMLFNSRSEVRTLHVSSGVGWSTNLTN